MNIPPKIRLFIFVILLFFFTFSATTKIIHGFQSNEFDFLKIAIALFGIGFSILNIVKIGKIINNK